MLSAVLVGRRLADGCKLQTIPVEDKNGRLTAPIRDTYSPLFEFFRLFLLTGCIEWVSGRSVWGMRPVSQVKENISFLTFFLIRLEGIKSCLCVIFDKYPIRSEVGHVK